jgi:hypothetical protein
MSKQAMSETASIRTAQIVGLGILALILLNGVLLYPNLSENGVLNQWRHTPVLFGVVCLLIVAHSIIPACIVYRRTWGADFDLESEKDVRSKLARIYLVKITYALAILGVGAWFGWMGYCMSGGIVDLIILLLVLYCMAIDFPRTSRATTWIDEFYQAIKSGSEKIANNSATVAQRN